MAYPSTRIYPPPPSLAPNPNVIARETYHIMKTRQIADAFDLRSLISQLPAEPTVWGSVWIKITRRSASIDLSELPYVLQLILLKVTWKIGLKKEKAANAYY